MRLNKEKGQRLTRSAAYWEAASVSERYADREYVVWYTIDDGYFVRRGCDGAQPGAEKIAVFLGGDLYYG
jgi:hypothetical protein